MVKSKNYTRKLTVRKKEVCSSRVGHCHKAYEGSLNSLIYKYCIYEENRYFRGLGCTELLGSFLPTQMASDAAEYC